MTDTTRSRRTRDRGAFQVSTDMHRVLMTLTRMATGDYGLDADWDMGCDVVFLSTE